MASLKLGSWWVLWVRVCLWLVHAPKCSNYALISLLFGLCKSVRIINPLIIHPNPHPRAPTCPSTREVLRARGCTLTFYPFIVFTFDSQLSLLKSLGVRHLITLSNLLLIEFMKPKRQFYAILSMQSLGATKIKEQIFKPSGELLDDRSSLETMKGVW